MLGEYSLSGEEQERIGVRELASMLLEVLQRNSRDPDYVTYPKMSLDSIKRFEFAVSYSSGCVAGKPVEHSSFREKFKQATDLLEDAGLIAQQHGQPAGYVRLTDKGKQTGPAEWLHEGASPRE